MGGWRDVVGLKDRVKRRTMAAGLQRENLMARAEGEEQMCELHTGCGTSKEVVDEWESVDHTVMFVESPRAQSMQVVDNWVSVDYTLSVYFPMSFVGDAELSTA
jgi:hypothetical protein